MKDIKVIETNQNANKHIIKRVAAYARVSTKQELQESSLDLQVRHYAKEIIFNPDYIFAGIYYDHGKSGTSMIKRDGLQALLKKAYAGHVDLILVKSLSRFARNTIDALNVIRETRKQGVEFFFEKENLSSLDTTIDMILTMMAGLAEAESQQISSNIRWGHRSRAKNGKVPIHPTFGYDINEDKKYVINETNASAVRKIYKKFLEGKKLNEILIYLIEKGFKTAKDREFSDYQQVKNILTNEIYIGRITYGKTFIKVDGLEKKSVINNGEQPKYIINNHHEPIIDIDTYNKVQSIFEEQKAKRKKIEKTDINNYEKFAYSTRHEGFIKRKRIGVIDEEGAEPIPFFRKSSVPKFYVKHTSKVLFRSLNVLSRKFGRLEALFDAQVDDILSKQKLTKKLTEQEKIVEDYMRQYYRLQRKTIKDKKDRIMLFELETLIIQESMIYNAIEDEYNNIEERLNHAIDLKKHFKELKYPTEALTPENVNNIFDGFLIDGQDTYIAFINISNKELTPEAMKKAAFNTPLHTGAYKTKGRIDAEIKWSIILT
ncbi:recombinase family protein [Liberiplasma polymorphum]|uniref:recombinase family protein n=1 Tax=Liberiplasma polymorphum TaxID=3374570 RepID=UPI00377519C0